MCRERDLAKERDIVMAGIDCEERDTPQSECLGLHVRPAVRSPNHRSRVFRPSLSLHPRHNVSSKVRFRGKPDFNSSRGVTYPIGNGIAAKE